MPKKPPLRPNKQNAVGRETNIPPIWNGLIYSEILNEFTRRIEIAFSKLDHGRFSEVISKAQICENRLPPRTRNEAELANSSSKKSQLFRAFKSGRELIRDLGIKNPKIEKLAVAIKGSASSFHSAQQECVRQLQSMLPHADDTGHMTWPPPVPAHLTINAFVSLSLRIHTETPAAAPKDVMREAARKTVMPVLAHWLCVSGISGRANFHGIKTLQAAFNGVAMPPVDTSDPDTLFNELAWQRVATVLAEATREIFGEESDAMLKELLGLIDNHIENPYGGQLWSMMGKLNGTPPGTNLLVVFECLNELHGKKIAGQSVGLHDSTYFCSRIRYDAIRLGHYDEGFKKAAAGDLDALEKLLKTTRGRAPEEKLSNAFILSRRTLLNAEDDEATTKRKAVIAKYTVELLQEISTNADKGSPIKEIADRYLLGFLTNPRFVKYPRSLDQLEERLVDYKNRAFSGETLVPQLMWRIFDARLNWAKAISGIEVDPANNVVSQYAKACEALFASVENRDLRETFESEAPIWILPEISLLIWLGEEFSVRSNIVNRLSQSHEELTSGQKKLENAATILTRIAETEFGVYYHHATERKRILRGLLHFAEHLGKARRSP